MILLNIMRFNKRFWGTTKAFTDYDNNNGNEAFDIRTKCDIEESALKKLIEGRKKLRRGRQADPVHHRYN